MNQVRSAKGEFTGRHMLVICCCFFGVIISVNLFMAISSSTSWTGLVVQNTYVASQEYEDKRIAHEQQVAAGWDASFAYTPGVARLNIVDSAGQPVDLGEVSILISRPVGGHDDQRLTLTASADGSYAAPLTLEAGVWNVLATAETSTGSFELHQRFKVEDTAP